MCNEYRRFVWNLTRTARPLTLLTMSALPKNLGESETEDLAAFNSLKETLEATVLKLPHSHGTFVIDIDACNSQVGCNLLQAEGDGRAKPGHARTTSLRLLPQNSPQGLEELQSDRN